MKVLLNPPDGGELWTYVGMGLLSSLDKPLDALKLSNMTTVGNALYVRAKQGGSTNSLFHLLPKTDTLLHIKRHASLCEFQTAVSGWRA